MSSRPSVRSMALSRYAYDLGVPLPDFLVRLRICTEAQTAAVLASGRCRLDGMPLTDPSLRITFRHIRAGSQVEYDDQIVRLFFWDDADPQNERALTSLRRSLQVLLADAETLEDVANAFEQQALMDARPLLQMLKDIEQILSRAQDDVELVGLVRCARIELATPSGEAARAELRALAGRIRQELTENLLPFQPMRARLQRPEAAHDARFPQDLRLYPTDEPFPECWRPIWSTDMFYRQFLKEWDGKSCPSCRTKTIEQSIVLADTAAAHGSFRIYRCTRCGGGWTERREAPPDAAR